MNRRVGGVVARRIGLLAAGLGALCAIVACSLETRYRVLTFFIDGVPPLEEYKARKTRSKEAPTTPTLAVAAAKPPVEFLPGGGRGSRHPLMTEAECNLCHNPTQALEVRADWATVCLQCHGQTAKAQGWNHGPINLGRCQPCHLFHEAPNPRLLAEPIPDLCLYCHGVKEGQKTYHNPGGMLENVEHCVKCHDAHHVEQQRVASVEQ
ncbi:MAG: hypothetical protein NTW86_21610 [Candidatus Sumerlaeota bacterium]|nr:hypothetical protein [Candidatus Sumerlaeota bacterium]